MFFILSKILAFLIAPLIWIFGLLIYSIIQKDQTRRKRFILLSLVILYLFSNPFLFNECMRRWEIPAVSDTSIMKKYDAVIVLGGVSYYDDQLERTQFSRGNDRLMQALRLYKQGHADKLFFTGGSGSITFPEMKEGIQIRKFLLDIGIPEEDIIIETESRNTRENAIFSKPILDKHFPDGEFLLVTSAFHMRRGMGCLNKVGIVADPYSTDRYSGPRRYQPDYLLMPSTDILFAWTNFIHELVGYLTYKIAGYI